MGSLLRNGDAFGSDLVGSFWYSRAASNLVHAEAPPAYCGASGEVGAPLAGFGTSNLMGAPPTYCGASDLVGAPLTLFGTSDLVGIPLAGNERL